MKNIHTLLSEIGISVPEDKKAEFDKGFAENYKTSAEFEKKVSRLTADLEDANTRADTAEEALKGFDGIDPANVKAQLEEANRKVKEAQESAERKIAERDFNDTLKAELENVKFTSAAARKAVEAEIRAAGLKHKNGKILGLSDLLEQIKKEDASAFVDEAQDEANRNAPRFAAKNGGNGGNPIPGKKYTMGEIMKMKNDNPNMDIKQFINNGGNN